ncbi:putative protein YIPF1/2 [Blattamonas nauphoetae]|uniref:Protein YIPF n=1 Tax=Blattamonas nauphoetae TaxID=2049346 RepID=A0ABQ9YA14_9EUKA|nr:putative protein YIPF1/2 [Blattamonas nauphoetae]
MTTLPYPFDNSSPPPESSSFDVSQLDDSNLLSLEGNLYAPDIDPKKNRSPVTDEDQLDSLKAPPTSIPQDNFDISGPFEDPTFTIRDLIRLKFWQHYYDVNTKTVVTRLFHSLLPHKAALYENVTSTKPDLYGPFWIATTVLFAISFFGNLSSLIRNAIKPSEKPWAFNFAAIGFGAILCYTITFLIPFLFALPTYFYRKSEAAKKHSHIVCLHSLHLSKLFFILADIYGYSLAPQFAISILTLIPSRTFTVILSIISCGYALFITTINTTKLVPLLFIFLDSLRRHFHTYGSSYFWGSMLSSMSPKQCS